MNPLEQPSLMLAWTTLFPTLIVNTQLVWTDTTLNLNISEGQTLSLAYFLSPSDSLSIPSRGCSAYASHSEWPWNQPTGHPAPPPSLSELDITACSQCVGMSLWCTDQPYADIPLSPFGDEDTSFHHKSVKCFGLTTNQPQMITWRSPVACMVGTFPPECTDICHLYQELQIHDLIPERPIHSPNFKGKASVTDSCHPIMAGSSGLKLHLPSTRETSSIMCCFVFMSLKTQGSCSLTTCSSHSTCSQSTPSTCTSESPKETPSPKSMA